MGGSIFLCSSKCLAGEVEDKHLGQRLPVWLMLGFGALSGVIAQTATYPLDVIRRHMQVQQQPLYCCLKRLDAISISRCAHN